YTKIFCLICILLVSHNHTKAQSDSVTTEKIFFVVRHAEKDTGANPEISTMGMQRAGDLNRFLNAEKIDRILVTKYRRTAMTGDSVRISKSIDTSIYPADRIGAGLQNRLK